MRLLLVLALLAGRHPAAFLARMQRGMFGTYEATYRVEKYGAMAPNGTIVVAARKLTANDGTLSFLFRSAHAKGYQWIEHGGLGQGPYEACWTRTAGWVCTRPGLRFYASNGYLLALEPFVPWLAYGSAAHVALLGHVFRKPSRAYGPLTCLRAQKATWCIARDGMLVSWRDSDGLAVTLLSEQARPPDRDFTPLGRPGTTRWALPGE
jgi:hypothetical protein